jgi:hypothetical protein
MKAKNVGTESVSYAASFLHRKYTILVKFNDLAIIPSEAIEARYWGIQIRNSAEHLLMQNCIFTTIDGVDVKLEFLVTWVTPNKDLDEECSRCFNLSFDKMKYMFSSRCASIGNYWHKIRMTKV